LKFGINMPLNMLNAKHHHSVNLDNRLWWCWLLLGYILLGGLQRHFLEVLLGTGERSRGLRRWWL